MQRKAGPKEVENQSAILDLGRKLMAESTISHPDRIAKFVYSGENVEENRRKLSVRLKSSIGI